MNRRYFSRTIVPRLIFGGMVAASLSGCMSKLEEQTKSTGSIIGKTTQEVQKFDPQAKQQVSDSKVRVDSPVFAGVQAYRPMIEQAMKAQIEHAIQLFRAEHDRYPKNYAEFMEKIIKENMIQLPVLPGGWKYAYDEKNHTLETVKAAP